LGHGALWEISASGTNKHIDAPMHEFDLGDGFGDGLGIGDITRDDHATIVALQGYFFESLSPSSHEHDSRTSIGEAHRTGRTDATAGTTNDYDLIHIACSIRALCVRVFAEKRMCRLISYRTPDGITY
jgi:hypothetical protein